jgi:hypothetical protein
MGAVISAGLLTFCGALMFWSDVPHANAQTVSVRPETGSKICAVGSSGKWRDSISVPRTFTAASCDSFRHQSEADSYQLGCLFSDGVALGDKNGLPPKRNCGW